MSQGQLTIQEFLTTNKIDGIQTDLFGFQAKNLNDNLLRNPELHNVKMAQKAGKNIRSLTQYNPTVHQESQNIIGQKHLTSQQQQQNTTQYNMTQGSALDNYLLDSNRNKVHYLNRSKRSLFKKYQQILSHRSSLATATGQTNVPIFSSNRVSPVGESGRGGFDFTKINDIIGPL